MMMRLSVAGLLLVTIAACGSTAPAGPTPQSAPPHKVVSETNRVIAVEVDSAPDEAGLRAIFDAVRATNRPDGGYFVQINCSTGGTEKADNRLANGRFAVGQLGVAQVGLEEGGSEFAVNDGRTCPVVSAPPS